MPFSLGGKMGDAAAVFIFSVPEAHSSGFLQLLKSFDLLGERKKKADW